MGTPFPLTFDQVKDDLAALESTGTDPGALLRLISPQAAGSTDDAEGRI